MSEKKLLKKLGEETLYSAKGHFKSCDLRRNLITYTIWTCAILNVVGIIGIHPKADKWFSAAGLFGTIALLIWNEGEGKNYRNKHKELGEKYLALHKQIRHCYFMQKCDEQEVNLLSAKVMALDQEDKLDIPGLARRWAKKSIENSDPETDNWFSKQL